jgi:hypothetical protein
LWTDNPLSIYAKVVTTIVDGIIYYDKEKDLVLRRNIQNERNRLIQKMSGEKKSGEPVAPATAKREILLHCEDEGDNFSGIIEDVNGQ